MKDIPRNYNPKFTAEWNEWLQTKQIERNACMTDLTFAALRLANLSRCRHWHGPNGVKHWTPERWMTALCGEVGEAANVLKKLFRVLDGMANENDGARQIPDEATAIAKIAEELADVQCYLDLFAASLNIDLAAATQAKFNSTSEKYKFPEKL